MSEGIKQFTDFLQSVGLQPSDPSVIQDDDEPRYYHIEGDKRGYKKASYALASDDGFYYGWACNLRTGEVHNWHTKAKRGWSADEKAEHKRKMEYARKKQAEQREDQKRQSREEAARIWAAGAKSGSSPYLERKGIKLKGVRYDGDTLLVPMWRDGKIVSVQRIAGDGGKLFLKHSDHVGAYFSIKGDLGRIAICEGVATGQVVHDATGWSVIVAFNAGNLKPVAKSIRAKYLDAVIVFAADDDHETTDNKGQPLNVGRDKAMQAAMGIGGAQVIFPPVEAGESDWDDVARRAGMDAVRDALLGAIREPAPMTDAQDDDTWEPDYDIAGDDVVESGNPMDQIRPLGHMRGEYYFFPRVGGQILSFSATALGRPQNLYQLAPRGFWEAAYAPETSMGKIADYASADLIAECQRKGIFSLEDARGVGVWRDRGGKLLVNCGDVIVGEGVSCHPSEFDGDYVYEAGQRVIDMNAAPLDSKEAARFRDICKSLTWKKGQSGDLIAGWCVVAAIGGALDWRPHVFVTGRKGSGKSTAMDKIIMGALHGIGIKRDGGTTEAGIRKAIGASSRPFIMDEAEAESGSSRDQMQKIFEYFRKASSGGVIENAYESYVARSAACFGGINPRIEQGADADRWSLLELVPNDAPDRDDHYKRLLQDIREVITHDFPDRLLVRTVANLDVLLHNVGVFVDVFSKRLGSKRAGDQIGTLVAGSHSLVSNKRVDFDFVEAWVDRQGWDFEELQGGGSDAETLMGYIMSARVKYDQDGMMRESSIGHLVSVAAGREGDASESAVAGLNSIGIKVEGGRLIISNTSPRIKAILRDTPWGVWRRTLGDFDGADNCGGKVVYFAAGLRTKATGVPLDAALGVDAGADVDSDGFEMEGFE